MKAERGAQRAEEDGPDTIEFAIYAVDQAEYAAIDAAQARAAADDAAVGATEVATGPVGMSLRTPVPTPGAAVG